MITSFLSRYSLYIAAAVLITLFYAERKKGIDKLRDRGLEVGFEIATIFLAVALAFAQDSYNRDQERLEKVRAASTAAAISLRTSLQPLAGWVAIGYDRQFSADLFTIPTALTRIEDDDELVGVAGAEGALRLSNAIGELRNSSQREDWGADRKDWKEKSCRRNSMVAQHLNAASRVLTELCAVMTQAGMPVPNFLKSSDIRGRGQPAVPIFLISACTMGPAEPSRESAASLSTNLPKIGSMMLGKSDCDEHDGAD